MQKHWLVIWNGYGHIYYARGDYVNTVGGPDMTAEEACLAVAFSLTAMGQYVDASQLKALPTLELGNQCQP